MLFAWENRCFSAELFLVELLHHFNSAQITLVKIVFWSVYSFVLNYRVLGHFVLEYKVREAGFRQIKNFITR